MPSFCSFGKAISEEKIYEKRKMANQKQKLPVVAK
jgi:hypothetical protein